EECKKPQTDLPIGIIGSLLITTVVYVAVALVLTGIQDTSGQVPLAFLKAPMAYCMSIHNLNWAAGLISIGSLAGLTSVLLVLEMAATRILYAMSRDHFISQRFQKLHPKFKTPAKLTWTVGILAVVGILTLNLDVAAELCNYGTFTSFIVVCVAILILRKTDPDRPRPFKVPFSPITPALGILCCGGLMVYKSMQQSSSALLFPVWLGFGAIIYLLYGFVKNRLNENKVHQEKVELKRQEILNK
ncbi:amino acid permease, partial [bacterium]|nr:amino acid permease [bacterium]